MAQAKKRSVRTAVSRTPVLRRLSYILLFCAKFYTYLHVATEFNLWSMWMWMHDPVGTVCDGRALPGNRSGIRILVYTTAKTGTTTFSKALHTLGLENALHSEDFLFHIWVPLSDRFWRRPEHGGSIFATRRVATPFLPARKSHSFLIREPGADRYVLENLRPGELAEAYSRCRTEAVVFDGLESAFWPTYAVSPGAKVFMLNWRPHDQWLRSGRTFSFWVYTGLLSLNYLNTGMHFLPWNALVLPTLDWLYDGVITNTMRSGKYLMSNVHWVFLLFRQQHTERRICQHWGSGLGNVFSTQERYTEFWEEAKSVIPKDKLFEFDMTRHTYKDICDFAGIEHPRCEANKLPNSGIVLMNHEREHPMAMLTITPWFLFLHYLNYNIFWGSILWILGVARRLFLVLLFPCMGCSKPRKGGKVKAA